MVNHDAMKSLWLQARDRLQAKALLAGASASLSVRCPGATSMWFGAATDSEPQLLDWRDDIGPGLAAVHASVYASRADVGAVAWGGGPFGSCLDDFGGALPQVFDEQARHIGPMPAASAQAGAIEHGLRRGGNALLCQGQPICLGTTCARMALNAELFEKCAKAYVLADATGGHVAQLPWLVRAIANARLHKDQRLAAQSLAGGTLPSESRGY